MPTFSACVDTKRHLVKIYSEFVSISSELVEISSEFVEISSELVEISSELVEISSELVSTFLELLIISTFRSDRRSVSGIFVSFSMALKADG